MTASGTTRSDPTTTPEHAGGPTATHVLVEGAPGVIARGNGIIIEGVAIADVVDAAARAVAGTARPRRIELCGGMPVEVAAQVRAALPDDVEVRVNRYGFESLDQAAAYKAAFEDGSGDPPGDLLVLHPAAASTPLVQRDGVLVAGVADEADLAERVREAQTRGAGLVELYGGLGIAAAGVARTASAGELPVGYC